MSDRNVERLQRSLHKVVTGAISLSLRKQLAEGETVTLKVSGMDYTISAADGLAKLRSGALVVVEESFVPWTEIDDNYEAMITAFGEKGEVDEEWFHSAGARYHERFV